MPARLSPAAVARAMSRSCRGCMAVQSALMTSTSKLAVVSSFWRALFAGQIVSADWVAEMMRARSEVPRVSRRYGLGFWLDESSEVVMLEGCDAGVSFRSVHDPARRITHTVVSNTSDGAWPITRLLAEWLST